MALLKNIQEENGNLQAEIKSPQDIFNVDMKLAWEEFNADIGSI